MDPRENKNVMMNIHFNKCNGVNKDCIISLFFNDALSAADFVHHRIKRTE